jgi:U4/U6 small nuclear ribonucleoprotein PRP31
MATLADELLNDFEDSGSERGEEEQNGLRKEEDVPNQHGQKAEGLGMDIDEDVEDEYEDEEMNGLKKESLDDVDDEEAAKAKVEKMQLGGVNDVRTVAGLMKTLEPVLEVSTPPPLTFSNMRFTSVARTQS